MLDLWWLIAGIEMRLTRNMLKYLYIYYLPSGLFVVVSWVRLSQHYYQIVITIKWSNKLHIYHPPFPSKFVSSIFSNLRFFKVGFLIPPEVVPGRMAMLITLFLVILIFLKSKILLNHTLFGNSRLFKGLFINDVIIFGGYRDPPPPPRHHSSLFGYPPSSRA